MRMNRRKLCILLLSTCAMLILSGTVVGVRGKYVQDTSLDGNVVITADLGTITVREHKVERLSTGEYVYSKNESNAPIVVSSNTYDTIIPGLDIPKNPYVTVSNKSPIPAYVFLNISGTDLTGTGIQYTLKACWQPVEGMAGLYVYSDSDKNPISVDSNVGPIYVIEQDTVYISQALNISGQITIDFQACMGEVAAGATPAAVYNSLFKSGS